jgi:hypothetical protein
VLSRKVFNFTILGRFLGGTEGNLLSTLREAGGIPRKSEEIGGFHDVFFGFEAETRAGYS